MLPYIHHYLLKVNFLPNEENLDQLLLAFMEVYQRFNVLSASFFKRKVSDYIPLYDTF